MLHVISGNRNPAPLLQDMFLDLQDGQGIQVHGHQKRKTIRIRHELVNGLPQMLVRISEAQIQADAFHAGAAFDHILNAGMSDIDITSSRKRHDKVADLLESQPRIYADRSIVHGVYCHLQVGKGIAAEAPCRFPT